jgi:hypothetical protein
VHLVLLLPHLAADQHVVWVTDTGVVAPAAVDRFGPRAPPKPIVASGDEDVVAGGAPDPVFTVAQEHDDVLASQGEDLIRPVVGAYYGVRTFGALTGADDGTGGG